MHQVLSRSEILAQASGLPVCPFSQTKRQTDSDSLFNKPGNPTEGEESELVSTSRSAVKSF